MEVWDWCACIPSIHFDHVRTIEQKPSKLSNDGRNDEASLTCNMDTAEAWEMKRLQRYMYNFTGLRLVCLLPSCPAKLLSVIHAPQSRGSHFIVNIVMFHEMSWSRHVTVTSPTDNYIRIHIYPLQSTYWRWIDLIHLKATYSPLLHDLNQIQMWSIHRTAQTQLNKRMWVTCVNHTITHKCQAWVWASTREWCIAHTRVKTHEC